MITVGGTRMCAPTEAWPLSATGPRITIAAPAENIPVSTKTNGHVLVNLSGNSLSTPMVSAVAALLKSMDPTLTPRQIRDNYLVRYAYPTAARVSGARLLPWFSVCRRPASNPATSARTSRRNDFREEEPCS